MKVFILFLFFLFPSIAIAQCDYEKLMEEGKSFLEKNDFRKALNAFNAAKTCDFSKAGAVDIYLNRLFQEIEEQRDDAIAAKIKAQKMRALVDNNTALAKAIADSLAVVFSELSRTRDLEAQAWAAKNALVKKAETLQRNLSKEDLLPYLLQKGYRHFEFDTRQISRDYSTALTYFSLASFLGQDTAIRSLIASCKLGIKADEYFYSGNIELAGALYDSIVNILETHNIDTEYEKDQIQHIAAVQELLDSPNNTKRIDANGRLVLNGNWWTIPTEIFQQYGHIKKIIFYANPNLNNIFQKAVNTLSAFYEVTIEESRLEKIGNWRALSGTKTLNITQNSDLAYLYNLRELINLEELNISNNAVLTEVSDVAISTLRILNVRGNNRLYSIDIDSTSLGNLKTLYLSDILYQNLPAFSGAHNLEEITLNSLGGLKYIPTLKSCPKINQLTIINNDKLTDMNNLNNVLSLKSLIVIDNDAVKSLANVTGLSNLSYLKINDNYNLKKMFKWEQTPTLKQVEILDNPKLAVPFSYSAKSIKKSKIEKNLYQFSFRLGLNYWWYRDRLNAVDLPSLSVGFSMNIISLFYIRSEIVCFNRASEFITYTDQPLNLNKPIVFDNSLIMNLADFLYMGIMTVVQPELKTINTGGIAGFKINSLSRRLYFEYKFGSFKNKNFYGIISVGYHYPFGYRKTAFW